MTDQQRALYVLTRLSNRRYEDHPDDRVVPIIEELAAVRAQAVARERAAIVASLVEQYGASCRATGGLFTGAAFLRAIESIEHGDHIPPEERS